MLGVGHRDHRHGADRHRGPVGRQMGQLGAGQLHNRFGTGAAAAGIVLKGLRQHRAARAAEAAGAEGVVEFVGQCGPVALVISSV